jgi:P-type conjugative transfer protein TrbJ
VSLVNHFMHPLGHINAMIDRVEGIPHRFEQVTERFDELYPPFEQGFWDGGTHVQQLRAFARQMRAAGRVAMQSHAILESIVGDELTLQLAVQQSDGAVGHLQAIQAGNNITALNTVQLIRMEQMLAAQGRMDTSRDMAEAAIKDQVMMRLDFVMEGWTDWTREEGVRELPQSFR